MCTLGKIVRKIQDNFVFFLKFSPILEKMGKNTKCSQNCPMIFPSVREWTVSRALINYKAQCEFMHSRRYCKCTITTPHWEKYRENFVFPQNVPIFSSKWANYSPILRKNGIFGGKIQIVPKFSHDCSQCIWTLCTHTLKCHLMVCVWGGGGCYVGMYVEDISKMHFVGGICACNPHNNTEFTINLIDIISL